MYYTSIIKVKKGLYLKFSNYHFFSFYSKRLKMEMRSKCRDEKCIFCLYFINYSFEGSRMGYLWNRKVILILQTILWFLSSLGYRKSRWLYIKKFIKITFPSHFISLLLLTLSDLHLWCTKHRSNLLFSMSNNWVEIQCPIIEMTDKKSWTLDLID